MTDKMGGFAKKPPNIYILANTVCVVKNKLYIINKFGNKHNKKLFILYIFPYCVGRLFMLPFRQKEAPC